MRVAELLSELRDLDAHIELDGDRLRGGCVGRHDRSMLIGNAIGDSSRGLLERIESWVRLQPGKIAAVAGSNSLTYAELWQTSGDLAHRLVSAGVGTNELIGVCVPRDEQMPLALLAVLRSGGAYVPLDPDFPDARLAYMVEHAGIRHMLVGRDMRLPGAISGSGARLHRIGSKTAGTEATNLPVVSPDALAYVLYTSGSTGKPKGVRGLRRNLDSFLAAMQREPGMQIKDRLCAVATLSFDIAGLEMYLPLVTGASMVIASRDQVRDPLELLALVAGQGISVLQTTPSLLRVLLDTDSTRVLRDLRLLVTGEALPPDLARRAVASVRELWNLYGPTETTIFSTGWKVPPQPAQVAIGKPIAGTSIYVLDTDCRPVAPGTEGELWIGGAGVAGGYLGRSDLTAERFVPDPFAGHGRMYRTGDLGRLENGLLYCHGRIDNQIKLRGQRIEPGEIEAIARTTAGVRDAAVAVHEIAPGDTRLVLYVVGDGEQLAESLKRTLFSQLPDYMQPQHIVWLGALPTTPNGKLDRRALPVPSDMQPTTERVAARSASEALVVAAFNEVLKRSDVGVFDDFFELGGHSLVATRLIAKLRVSAKVALPVRSLFEHPTPERLAAAIDALVWVAGSGDCPTAKGRDDREEFEL